MSLSAGIIGLPNVGKSTLFNAITNSNILAENYPFATIEPNQGVVQVKDKRLDKLEEIYHSKNKIYTTFDFTDIAGLVKGASKGDGLGNKFLSHIRSVDALCHVVRCFENPNIIHVEGSINPVRDIETINLELALADLEQIEKRIEKVERKAKSNVKEVVNEYNLLVKLKKEIEENQTLNHVTLNEEEKRLISSFQLLSIKPMLYIANVSEEDLLDLNNNKHYRELLNYAKLENKKVIPLSADLEVTLSQLEEDEKLEFLKEFNLSKSGLDDLIKTSYEMLGLRTYFTAGEKEAKAWTFKDGMTAPECAGIIHTDFEKGFIKAEVLSYDDLMKYETPQKAKEQGRVRQEGKNYLVQDGDIMLFKFNVTR